MAATIGFPIKLLHEAEGHVVTIELKSGEMYRGRLVEAEDNMNCQLSNITMTAKDGRVSALEQVFLRGSHIRFMILPDMLKNSPMFTRIDPKRGVLRGRGSGTERARAAGRGREALLPPAVCATVHELTRICSPLVCVPAGGGRGRR